MLSRDKNKQKQNQQQQPTKQKTPPLQIKNSQIVLFKSPVLLIIFSWLKIYMKS